MSAFKRVAISKGLTGPGVLPENLIQLNPGETLSQAVDVVSGLPYPIRSAPDQPTGFFSTSVSSGGVWQLDTRDLSGNTILFVIFG